MLKIPDRVNLANLPTRIERLERFSALLGGPDIYIKRDDQTGMEVSGNKVRKLEFSVREALDRGCDCLVTCGGMQSNHCRATAAVAAKLGMKACLVLMSNSQQVPDGNLLLDKMLGAEIRVISEEEYANRRAAALERVKAELEDGGLRPYVIPEGASNGIGGFGYYIAMEEIAAQEREMGIRFDGIAVAVGSGGTYAGLLMAKKLLGHPARIIGINVSRNAGYFKERIAAILEESGRYLGAALSAGAGEIDIIDGYVGRGYALSSAEELRFIHELAMLEGVILDPVYTGKAMYGLANEIRSGRLRDRGNLLFIHTGGLFDIFNVKESFDFRRR